MKLGATATALAVKQQRARHEQVRVRILARAWHRHVAQRGVIADCVGGVAVGNHPAMIASVQIDGGNAPVGRLEERQSFRAPQPARPLRHVPHF